MEKLLLNIRRQFGFELESKLSISLMSIDEVGIAFIDVKVLEEVVCMKIFAKRVGLIIGKGGDNINSIKTCLEEKFQKTFKIDFQEYNPLWDSKVLFTIL